MDKLLSTDETKVEIFIHNRQCISTNTSYCRAWWWRGNGFGLLFSHRTWKPCIQWVNDDHLRILNYSKYSRVECEAFCPTSKDWLKMGHATGSWSQAYQKIYKRMTVKEKNQGAVMAHSKSSLFWNTVVGPKESCARMNACKHQWTETTL